MIYIERIKDTFRNWIKCSLKYTNLRMLYIQEHKGTFNKKVKLEINCVRLLSSYENKLQIRDDDVCIDKEKVNQYT